MSEIDKKKYFEIVYEENFKFIFRFFYKRVSSVHDAQDLTSDVFEAIWKNIEKIDQDKEIKYFIFAIARNKLNDFLRKKYNFDPEIIDSDFLSIDLEDENLDDSSETKLNIIDGLVNELDEKYKNIYQLKYKEKLNYSQIAQKMKITLNNAKVLNNRLIIKLKQKWTMKT